jgi:hypothetical protein
MGKRVLSDGASVNKRRVVVEIHAATSWCGGGSWHRVFLNVERLRWSAIGPVLVLREVAALFLVRSAAQSLSIRHGSRLSLPLMGLGDKDSQNALLPVRNRHAGGW